MRKFYGVIGLLCCCMIVGCGFGTEGPQPTVAVSPTEGVMTESPTPTEAVATALPVPTEAVMTEQPMPTGAVVAVPGGIPIDEEHFGDNGFCELLKREYDLNGDGAFSKEELEAIEALALRATRLDREPYTEVKGFSYFTNMEYLLVMRSVEQMELCDVPNLESIYIKPSDYVDLTIQIDCFTVKRCPKLSDIWVENALFGNENESGTESEGAFGIEDCVALEVVELYRTQFENVAGMITGTPELHIRAGSLLKANKNIVLDSDIMLSFGSDVMYNTEKEEVEYPWEGAFSWKETPAALGEAWIELLENTEKIKNGFFVCIEEVVPAIYDEHGRKGYYVWLENQYIRSGIYTSTLCDIIYSKEELSPEQFSIAWEGPVSMEIWDYSPLRGMYTAIDTDATIEYVSEEEKQEVGELCISIGGAISNTAETKLTSELSNLWAGNRFVGFENVDTWGFTLEEQSPLEYQPKEGDLCISKEVFTSVMFRRYLREYVDSNRDGYLSVEERECVTELILEIWAEHDVLDGFQYFPNLKTLVLPTCKEAVCKDCLNLENLIGMEEDHIGNLVIENCPKLNNIDMNAYQDCVGNIYGYADLWCIIRSDS